MIPYRVVVADDQRDLAEDAAEGLNRVADMDVVALAHTGREALEQARAHQPDVVLMDLEMPGMDGIAATRILRSELPAVEVLVWTVWDDSRSLFEAYQAGAKGYLFKSASNAQIAAGIRATAQGEATIPAPLATAFRNEFERIARQNAALKELYSLLTPREIEVLIHLRQAEKNRQIAQALCITEEAVKKHVRSILDKLQVNTRIEAALLAQQRGLL